MEILIGMLAGSILRVFVVYFISAWMSEKLLKKQVPDGRIFALFICTTFSVYLFPNIISRMDFDRMINGITFDTIGLLIVTCIMVLKLTWKKSLMFSFYAIVFWILISNIVNYLTESVFKITNGNMTIFDGIVIMAYSPFILALLFANNKLPWIKASPLDLRAPK